MNFQAFAFFSLACSIPQDQAYNQPELRVRTTGAAA